jgi:outer membrane protein TolC
MSMENRKIGKTGKPQGYSLKPLWVAILWFAIVALALITSTVANAATNLLADAGESAESDVPVTLNQAGVPEEVQATGQLPSLTIEESLQRALSDNRNLELARQAVEIARAGGRSALASFLPDLRFAYIYTRLADVSTIEVPGVGEFTMGNQDSFRLALSFTMPIYSGGQYGATVRASEAQGAASETRVRQVETLIAAGVVAVYSYSLEARQALEVSRASKTHVDEVLRTAQATYDQGLLPLSDLLSVRVAQSSAAQAVLQAERNLETAQSSLAYLIGANIGDRWELEPLEYPVYSVPFSLETLWEWALSQRPELIELEHNRAALEAQMDAIKSGRRPRVNFEVDFSRSGNLPDGTSQGESAGFGEGATFQGIIGVYWDLYDFGRTDDLLAPLEEQMALLDIQEADMREQVKKEVESALLNVRNQYESISISNDAVTQAQEAYRVAKRRQEEGLGLILQVLDAESTLLRTSAGDVHITYEYYRGLASLAASIGMSMDDLVALLIASNEETEEL